MRPSRSVRVLVIAALLFFNLVYGMATAIFVPYLVVPLAVPAATLALLTIWALPDSVQGPVRSLEVLFFASIIILVLWPNYLAIALPGLPWITLGRLVGFPFAIVLLVCASVSSSYRSTVSAALKTSPWAALFICSFMVLQVISVAFSADKGGSMDRLISVEISWTATFFAAVYVFAKPGRAERFTALLCLMSLGLVVIAIWEHILNRLPWVGHVPSFLKVNDPVVATILAGTSRMGKQAYRSQATFSTSLGFSEYLALVMPFALHFAMSASRRPLRILGIVTIPALVIGAVYSQSRTGMVGMLLSVLVAPFVWAVLRKREQPQNVPASVLLYSSPALAGVGLILSFVVPGLKYRIWGGGGESYSNQARVDQMHMGLPKIAHHPWGYGIGQGAKSLGYLSPGGGLTIDSYSLRLALEYGVLGFLIYYLMMLSMVAYCVFGSFQVREDDGEGKLLAPTAVAIFSFIIMKIVFAQEDNIPILDALFGLALALRLRVLNPGVAAAGAKAGLTGARVMSVGLPSRA